MIEPEASGVKWRGTSVLPAAAGSVTTIPHREIPEPSEPAERYELEREMLDLIAPSAKGNWPVSEKVIVRPPTPAESTVSASVMPGGFRLLVPESTWRKKAPRADEISPAIRSRLFNPAIIPHVPYNPYFRKSLLLILFSDLLISVKL